MQPLILHRVRNGFLVALHAGEKFIDLSEAFVAHDASELVAHIEAHFSKSPTPTVVVPADAVLAALHGARNELTAPEVTDAVPSPASPPAQVQA